MVLPTSGTARSRRPLPHVQTQVIINVICRTNGMVARSCRHRVLARPRTVLSYRVAVSTAGARKRRRSFLSLPLAQPCSMTPLTCFRPRLRTPTGCLVYAVGCASIVYTTHTRPSDAECGITGNFGRFIVSQTIFFYLRCLFLITRLFLGVSTII